MLTAIKERASGWIAYTLVGFISIPFVLWGINSYFEGASKITVATVNGVEVDETIYQQALSEQRRSLVQMMGRNVDAEIFASEPFKLQVLESLIDTRLQAEYLADRGYRITNEQLSSRIAAFAAFQSEGRFDSARYEMLLQNAGLTVEGFERQQRQQRREIFNAEDEIIDKRDELIDSLQVRLKETTETELLFTLRWQVM